MQPALNEWPLKIISVGYTNVIKKAVQFSRIEVLEDAIQESKVKMKLHHES